MRTGSSAERARGPADEGVIDPVHVATRIGSPSTTSVDCAGSRERSEVKTLSDFSSGVPSSETPSTSRKRALRVMGIACPVHAFDLPTWRYREAREERAGGAAASAEGALEAGPDAIAAGCA